MNDLLTDLGLKEGTLLASLFGALVGLKFVPGAGILQRVTNAVGGALIAAYGSPFITNYFTLSQKLEASVAFMVGMFGITITSALMEEIPLIIKSLREKYAK